MRGRDDHDGDRLAQRELADAMVDGDVREVYAGELGGDLGEDVLGHRGVGLVLEALHVSAAGTAPHGSGERRDRARLLRRDLGDRRVESGASPRGKLPRKPGE